jgi:hypothetical protein
LVLHIKGRTLIQDIEIILTEEEAGEKMHNEEVYTYDL